MPQRKMLQSSKGALLLLFPWLGGLVLGEVGDFFSPCLHFFYQSAPPAGLDAEGYQPICQRYLNQYRFASLYHRPSRTSLYSAYIFTPMAGKRPSNRWKYEPQLAFSGGSPEMHAFPKGGIDQNVLESQAVLLDYKNSSYTKGHLNPSSHHHTVEDRKATFTLTNLVPQRAGSNSGPWATLEAEVRARLESFCEGPAFVITGALPYASGGPRINNRVAVPEYMWSAYCCPSYNASLPESVQPHFPTYAAVGRNDQQSGEEIVQVDPRAKVSVQGYDVRRMPLETLEAILTQRLAMPISLFHGQCQ